MAHSITATSEFSAITVPNGSDDHAQLAEFMEAFVQSLANRTEYLRVNAVLLNVAHVWTATQTFPRVNAQDIHATSLAATGAVTTTGNVQGRDVIATRDVHATHNVVADAQLQGATLAVSGDASTQSLTVTNVATVGGLVATDGANVGLLISSGDVKGNTVTSATDIFLPGGNRIRLTGDDASKLRWKNMQIAPAAATMAAPGGQAPVWELDTQTWYADGIPGRLTIALPNLPSTCKIKYIEAYFKNSIPCGLELITSFADWTLDDVDDLGVTSIQAVSTPNSSAGKWHRTVLNAQDHVLDSVYETLLVRVSLNSGCRLGRMRVQFQDVGPRSE